MASVHELFEEKLEAGLYKVAYDPITGRWVSIIRSSPTQVIARRESDGMRVVYHPNELVSYRVF